MCLVTLTTALFCGIYIFGKLDISAESITKLAIKTITGRDAVAVASSEVKRERSRKRSERRKTSLLLRLMQRQMQRPPVKNT